MDIRPKTLVCEELVNAGHDPTTSSRTANIPLISASAMSPTRSRPRTYPALFTSALEGQSSYCFVKLVSVTNLGHRHPEALQGPFATTRQPGPYRRRPVVQ